jgi:hypothetical protein
MAAYLTTNDRRQPHDLAIKAMRPLHGSATLVNVNDVRGHALRSSTRLSQQVRSERCSLIVSVGLGEIVASL